MSRFLRGCGALVTLAFIIGLSAPPASAQVSIGASLNFGSVWVNIGPPPLPYYAPPPPPQPNYAFMPGYWAWGPGGYYWVPGTWVAAYQPGYYWTPGYWGYDGYSYGWNPGYWGTQVGYYGGINYGGGYYGNGYSGGRWQGRNWQYNSAVYPVNRRWSNYNNYVYANRNGVSNYSAGTTRYSYNGRGGIQARPSAGQVAFARQSHVAFTPAQREHVQVAASNRNFYSSVNHGRPAQVTAARPYTPSARPANFAPIRTQDQSVARAHVVPAKYAASPRALHPQAITAHGAPPNRPAAVVHHTTTTTNGVHARPAPAARPAVVHNAPVHNAPAYHAPVQHAAAPVVHHAAAPAYHAPVQHAAQPAYHAAPAYHASVQHAAVRPAYHPVQHAAPAYHAAPQRAAPQHAAPQRAPQHQAPPRQNNGPPH